MLAPPRSTGAACTEHRENTSKRRCPTKRRRRQNKVVKIVNGRLSVSNQTDPNNKQDKQSPFAPRRMRDANDKESRRDAPKVVETVWTEFRDRPRLGDSEWSPAGEDQPARDRLPNAANLQE